MWDSIIITPFINVLLFIYNLIGQNFGVAIILFTLLIRLITYPLTLQQIKGAKAMQELNENPKFKEIQEKYKNDRERLAQEQMELYKEMGVNPMASCLPTLIQFPIIIGLYQSIIRSLAATPIELLNFTKSINPSFLDLASIIPLNSDFLWMNLGQPERLSIPFLPFDIPILAILVVITSYLQTKMTQSTNPQQGGQGAMMGNMMTLYMPLLMGYLAYSFASGLAVYFVTSNLLYIIQHLITGKVDIKKLLPKRNKDEASITKTKK